MAAVWGRSEDIGVNGECVGIGSNAEGTAAVEKGTQDARPEITQVWFTAERVGVSITESQAGGCIGEVGSVYA